MSIVSLPLFAAWSGAVFFAGYIHGRNAEYRARVARSKQEDAAYTRMTERDLTDKDIQTLSSQVNTSHVKYEVIDQESKDRMIADMQRRLHLRTPHSPTGGGGLIDLVAVSPAYDIKKVKCSGFMHITKNGPI